MTLRKTSKEDVCRNQKSLAAAARALLLPFTKRINKGRIKGNSTFRLFFFVLRYFFSSSLKTWRPNFPFPAKIKRKSEILHVVTEAFFLSFQDKKTSFLLLLCLLQTDILFFCPFSISICLVSCIGDHPKPVRPHKENIKNVHFVTEIKKISGETLNILSPRKRKIIRCQFCCFPKFHTDPYLWGGKRENIPDSNRISLCRRKDKKGFSSSLRLTNERKEGLLFSL